MNSNNYEDSNNFNDLDSSSCNNSPSNERHDVKVPFRKRKFNDVFSAPFDDADASQHNSESFESGGRRQNGTVSVLYMLQWMIYGL